MKKKRLVKDGDRFGWGAFSSLRQYVTGIFMSCAERLPEEIYAHVLDSIVVACVDILVFRKNGCVLLVRRRVEPQPDWWIPGGRMMPGESFQEAAGRIIERELGLKINSERFIHANRVYNLIFGQRQQKPQDNGTHTISVTCIVVLDDDEIDSIGLSEEFCMHSWEIPSDVTQAEGVYHNCLRQMVVDAILAYEEARRIERVNS